MESDLRTIRLCRKSVGKKMENMEPEDKEGTYFATDYFDILRVEKKEMEDSFADVLDIWKEETYEKETTIQSYTMYFSEKMRQYYEINQSIAYRQNPFDNTEDMPYLSIIQIHITPEIMARMDYGAEDLWNSKNHVILEPFVEDLYDTLDLYQNHNESGIFAARVYLLLSAGDFAIVIRSQKADTSYHISSYLRKREAGIRGAGAARKSSDLVLYKTYTLLTLGNRILEQERVEEEHVKENYFVVRGCYSNKYWHMQDEIKAYIEENKIEMSELYHLSGRYDFTVTLTESEFFDLLPDITGVEKDGQVKRSMDEKKQTPIVRYIRYLQNHKYLSYINERYIMTDSVENIGKEKDAISKRIILKLYQKAGQRDLSDINNDMIDRLITKHEEVLKHMRNMVGYRKHIDQYLFLVKKQILLCRCINELSDTRIYAGVLAEQLEVVLDSADGYIKSCENRDAGNLLDLLEDYLRKAVFTLDCYAAYIRNNNLQSLQTPNYNIESTMGMEKILIGYSELLWKMIQFYEEYMQMAPDKQYLPVVIPDLHDKEVNVEVLFPDGNDSDREENEEDLDKSQVNRYLMVIGSSTLAELSDLPVMVSALFHEIAHQIRYEEREKRNDALLKTSVKAFMSNIAQRITEGINREVGEAVDSHGALIYGLTTCLTTAYIKNLFVDDEKKNRYSYQYQDAPLSIYRAKLEDGLNDFISNWISKWDLEKTIKEFICEIRSGYVAEDEKFNQKVGYIAECLENIKQFNSREETTKGQVEREEKIVGWAFDISWLSAYESLNEEEKNKVPKREWSGKEGENTLYSVEWEKNFCEVQNKNVNRIWKNFHFFSIWLDGYIGSRHQYDQEKGNNINFFTESLYELMRKYWCSTMEQCRKLYDSRIVRDPNEVKDNKIPSFRYWTLAGRYLGLDHDTKKNRNKFQNAVIKDIHVGEGGDLQSVIGLYREETADLFMCSVMNLSPFGYLNLAAFLLPQNTFGELVDGERLFCVIYVEWCHTDGNMELSWRKYTKLCCRIFCQLREYCLKCLEDCDDYPADNTDKVRAFIIWEDMKETTMDQLYYTVIGLNHWIREGVDKLGSQERLDKWKAVIGQLENAGRICGILNDLIQEGRFWWEKLSEEEEMLADLSHGVVQLGKFHDKMEKCKDDAVLEIVELCKSISAFLNKSHSQSGVFQDKMLNQKCMEILLKMFYNNKFRKAQENMGEEITVD